MLTVLERGCAKTIALSPLVVCGTHKNSILKAIVAKTY